MPGMLYIVGTPIGNLGDLSPRALETLMTCDFIAAEDTRVTRKLLTHFDFKKELLPYHEHNRKEAGERILGRMMAGETCALVTDAGMPAISDPGEDLVNSCHENGIPVASVPGPSAVVTALALSGLHTARFTFEGFLSVSKKSRREHLASLVNETRTMVFYEAPHKLPATLRDMYEAFGDRRIALVKEITKIHENAERTTLKDAAEKYETVKPKGEYVLIIEAKTQAEIDESQTEDPVALAKSLLEQGLSASEAAKQAARLTGVKKGDIYKQLLNEE
ncbi:MAG: 16S rRNA (cytidine(1402)-2'-O)-methyltransferase [Clostridia bacterium]|nr:16S rRNA (cytidine(1402)-2'-O)-methyltransferase [Clostridia bacterium]